MATINKITTLAPIRGVSLTTELIQAHMDEQNANGFHLITVDNLVGWYRFFWAKEE